MGLLLVSRQLSVVSCQLPVIGNSTVDGKVRSLMCGINLPCHSERSEESRRTAPNLPLHLFLVSERSEDSCFTTRFFASLRMTGQVGTPRLARLRTIMLS